MRWVLTSNLPLVACRRPALAGALIAAVLTVALPALAQRQRLLPPEPARKAWISAESEQQLRSAIAQYQSIVAAGGWTPLPDRITLRPGDSHEAVPILRRRLKASGDLQGRGGDDYGFDPGLEDAVRRYQARMGLEPTGVVYGITQRSLNVPAETRLKQLETNLVRLQQALPRVATAPRAIVMNIASFELQAMSGGAVELTSRTIAGKRATPTPVVSANLQAINILPYWHVPASIAKAALVPAVRKDPSYLYKERIRVFSSFGGQEIDPAGVNWWGPEADRYVFRQDPGAHNALGVMRFDMPNKHIVYMHDTPMKNLFGYFERAYSAGCVRVQDYYGLASWLLADQPAWNRASLQAAVDAGAAQTIKLTKPVPVHFVYLTAWVDNGVVNFRNDLYNQDEAAAGGGEEQSARVLSQPIAP